MSNAIIQERCLAHKAAYLQEVATLPPSMLRIDATKTFSAPYLLHHTVNLPEYEVVQGQEELVFVQSSTVPHKKTACIQFPGGINIPYSPAKSGYNTRRAFFVGPLMSDHGTPPKNLPFLVAVDNPSGIPIGELYGICLSDDGSLMTWQMVKTGQTAEMGQRRSNHETNTPGTTGELFRFPVRNFTLASMEALLQACLAPWRSDSREKFVPPIWVQSDLKNITSEAMFLKWAQAMLSDEGPLLIHNLTERVIHGRTLFAQPHRNIVLQPELAATAS